MSPIHEFQAILAEIAREWDQADEDIKLAEQVCLKITFSSIFELRYAGRRIIDALNKITADGSQKEILDLLQDAKFDCHRARHDAVDAATSKIAIDIENMGKKLGYRAILKAYPEFSSFRQQLSSVRNKIAESRGDRQNREAIYVALEQGEFKSLVNAFNGIQEAEPIMKDLAISDKKHKWIGYAFGIIGIIIAIISFIVTNIK